jgi:membrane protease YdiL (CAAX protease family)
LEAILINYLKYGNFNFMANVGKMPFLASLGLSFATAISEEISFRGYLFNRVWQVLGSEVVANLSTSLVWAVIHIPIVVFVWKLNFSATLIYMFLTTLFGIGSAFVFARTKNVASSILLHVLWEWPIILFR